MLTELLVREAELLEVIIVKKMPEGPVTHVMQQCRNAKKFLDEKLMANGA